MPKRKFNENIHYAFAVAVSVACVLVLFFNLLSENVKANSEISFVFDAYHCHHDYCGEDNKSENEASPICSEPCNSCSCNIMMVLSSISVSTNSNTFKKINLFLEEQLYTQDILRSIFKPPNI